MKPNAMLLEFAHKPGPHGQFEEIVCLDTNTRFVLLHGHIAKAFQIVVHRLDRMHRFKGKVPLRNEHNKGICQAR